MLHFIYKLPLGVVSITVLAVSFIYTAFCEKYIESLKKQKLIHFALAAISVFSIIFAVFTGRSDGESVVILEPFISFEIAETNPEIYRTMLMNVALFFPFGLSFSNILSKRLPTGARVCITVSVAAVFSIGIEFIQYRFSLGTCELDDVICNTVGALTGAFTLVWNKLLIRLRMQKTYDDRITRYLMITFMISWSCWCLLSVVTSPEYQFSFATYASAPLHIIGGFAPFFGALAVSEEKLTFRRVINTLIRYKKGTLRYLLLFSLLESAVFGLSSRELNTSLPIYLIPLILVQATLIYGGNEEIGWRSTLQPILERKLPFPIATVTTGVIWSVWHIPLWFVDGSSQQNIPFLLYLILGIILSFWLAALYKRTESVMFCSILHGLTNTLLSAFVIYINWILIAGLILITVISVLIWYNTDKTENREE